MTAVSFSINRGVDGFKQTDITVGSTAPATGDVMLSFNVLDTNSKNMNDGDLIRALKAFRLWILTNGALNVTAITNQPSGPPN
jgi:hypothetical protein